VQPQIETRGVLSAEARCIAPVSPPMTSCAFSMIAAVSCSVVIPQNEVIAFFGVEEISVVAIAIESGPPTIAICMSCETNS